MFAQQPVPPKDETPESLKAYEKAKEEWIKNNPAEYEKAVQSKAKPVVAGAASPPDFPRFLGYPTSHERPIRFESGDAKADDLVYEMRLQHWTLIHDFKNYPAKYGSYPSNFPGNVTAEQYSKNPPSSAYSEDLERAMLEKSKTKENSSTH